MAIQTTVIPSDKQKTLEGFQRYLRLSNLLFNNHREEIYNVSGIKEDNEFF